MSGAAWQRIVQHGKQLAADERLATELGRLNRFGELTAAQTVVGFKIAEIYGRYEGLKGLRRSVRSPSYNATFGESSVAEELLGEQAREELEHRIRAATAAFRAVAGHNELVREDGREKWIHRPGEIPTPLLNVVEQLCVEDRAIAAGWYPQIRRLFDRLAMSWGITVPRRSGRLQLSSPPAKREAPAPKRPPRANLDKVAWLLVMRAMRPDLSNEQLELNYEFAIAVKQREIFRRSQGDKNNPNVVRLLHHLNSTAGE
jgi:hypothetical protein